jgi:hypothetical protein
MWLHLRSMRRMKIVRSARKVRTRKNISSRIIACHSATRVPSGEGEAEARPEAGPKGISIESPGILHSLCSFSLSCLHLGRRHRWTDSPGNDMREVILLRILSATCIGHTCMGFNGRYVSNSCLAVSLGDWSASANAVDQWTGEIDGTDHPDLARHLSARYHNSRYTNQLPSFVDGHPT